MPGRSTAPQDRRAEVLVEVTPPPFSTGIARYMAGDFAGAEAAFRIALQEYDDTEEAHRRDAASLRTSAGSTPFSPAELKQRTDTAYNLGVVLMELSRSNDAIVAYERVLEMDPDHEGALLNLAGIYASLGKWGSAESFLKHATKTHPQSSLLHDFSAKFYALPGAPQAPS